MSAEIIKEFLIKMKTQDNRSTAFPFYYVIRTEVIVHAPIEDCEEKRFYYDDCEYESAEAMEKSLREYGYGDDEIRDAKRRATEYGIRREWVRKGMFLTETDAEEHLKANHYHYSHNAHTYVEHAWRAPELTEFFKALFEHFNIVTPHRTRLGGESNE